MARPPHLLLSARAGWQAGAVEATLSFDAAGNLSLAPLPGRGRRLRDASGCAPALLSAPVGRAASADGEVFVADANARTVTVLTGNGRALRAIWGPFAWRPWDVAVTACSEVWVSAPEEGRVHRFDRRGKIVSTLLTEAGGAPLLRPERLALDCEGRLYVSQAGKDFAAVYSADGDFLEIIALAGELAYEAAGTFRTLPLDSLLDRCPWHRVILKGEIPQGSRVRAATFTSEAAKSEAELELLPEGRWAPAGVAAGTVAGEWDCLVQSPPGRFLWLRLTLEGDGATTPTLEHARLEMPRRSSLRHLPAVYQEDLASRHFLDRWLSIFDATNENLGEVIGGIARLFDPQATPAGENGEGDFLTWVASWIGLGLDRHLPVARKRRLLAEAHHLYRLRGTLEGLKLALALTLGIEPLVLEQFRLRRWLYVGSSRLGDCAELFGPELSARLELDVTSRIGDFQLLDTGDPLTDPQAEFAHRFTVFVPEGGRTLPRPVIERVIELAKPAHTAATVATVPLRLQLGREARVGLNTVVGRYPAGIREGQNRLGQDTVLTAGPAEERRPTLKVGLRSRIGASTLLD